MFKDIEKTVKVTEDGKACHFVLKRGHAKYERTVKVLKKTDVDDKEAVALLVEFGLSEANIDELKAQNISLSGVAEFLEAYCNAFENRSALGMLETETPEKE